MFISIDASCFSSGSVCFGLQILLGYDEAQVCIRSYCLDLGQPLLEVTIIYSLSDTMTQSLYRERLSNSSHCISHCGLIPLWSGVARNS